jgi:hypothetical protein
MSIHGRAVVFLAVPAFCESAQVLRSGEAIFTVSVRGGVGVRFSGSCLSTTAEGAPVGTKGSLGNKLSISRWVRMDFVVPIAVELIPSKSDARKLLVVDFGSRRIDAVIDFGANP